MQMIINSPTPNLEESLLFYTRLDYKILSIEKPTLISDGQVLIEINPDRKARAGVKLLAPSWKDTSEKLATLTKVLPGDQGYLLADPSGSWIYLIETEQSESYDISDVEKSILGNYAGLSLECVDIELAQKIWETLSFSKTMGSIEQGWMTLTNESGAGLSLMKPKSCPHLFFNPSLTYFNGKENLAIIDKIKSLSIPITEEVTAFNEEGIVDNVILRDPGGYGFFIFND